MGRHDGIFINGGRNFALTLRAMKARQQKKGLKGMELMGKQAEAKLRAEGAFKGMLVKMRAMVKEGGVEKVREELMGTIQEFLENYPRDDENQEALAEVIKDAASGGIDEEYLAACMRDVQVGVRTTRNFETRFNRLIMRVGGIVEVLGWEEGNSKIDEEISEFLRDYPKDYTNATMLLSMLGHLKGRENSAVGEVARRALGLLKPEPDF